MIQSHAEISICEKIHKTAVIFPNAQIGRNVEIGPYAVIGNHVSIGDDSKIGAYTVIDGWTSIGRNCNIHSSVSIGAEPQDKKFRGEKSYVSIGDSTQIREFVTINRATGEEENTQVGSNCLLLAYSHVAHNCCIGNYVVMSNAVNLAGHIEIEDRVTIGGLVGVHQFVKIGKNAMIGGFSKIVQDVPPFVTVDGHPGQIVGLNTLGMIRSGIKEETRNTLKKAYRILYFSGLRLDQALVAMEQQLSLCDEVVDFIRFLRNSERGICRKSKK
jgi:UDP-N-acetylglucosamine acyltransferase